MNFNRRPPPQGAPPSYAFVTRVYRKSLRPVVIFTATIGAIWTLFSSIGFFRSINLAKQDNEPKLATIATALGAMYIAVFAIEVYGIFSAVTQRLALIGIYAILSVFGALVVIAAGFLQTVITYTMKNDLINECTDETNGDTFVFRFGPFGPTEETTLDRAEALQFCQDAWSHASWSTIVSLLIMIILAGMFSMIAFSYYRQILDPSSAANAFRARSNDVRMGPFPSHYTSPYSASTSNLDAPMHYSPPQGPPPIHDDQFAPPYDGKLPGYGAGFAGDMDKTGFADQKANPFGGYDEERDVASPPGPGAKNSFP